MTITERLNQVLSPDFNPANDPAGEMLQIIYWMGAEAATRHVSDMYTDKIAEMRKRADACRYHWLANQIIGPRNQWGGDWIYMLEYREDTAAIFGDDEAIV